MDNELSSVTKLAAQFGLLDDMKSKWETSLRPGIDLAASLLNIHSARLSLQPETMILSEPLALRAARLWNSVPDVRRPLVLAGTIFLQVLALAMSMFMALQYFLRYAHRIPVPNCSHAFSNTWSMTVLSESHFRTICHCLSYCQLGKFFCTANCRSFGNPAGSGPNCRTWFWMACCWTEERSPVRLSWRPGNLGNVAEFHMLTLQLCD